MFKKQDFKQFTMYSGPIIVFLGLFYLLPLIKVNNVFIPITAFVVGWLLLGLGILFKKRYMTKLGAIFIIFIVALVIARYFNVCNNGWGATIPECKAGSMYCRQTTPSLTCRLPGSFHGWHRLFIISLPGTLFAYIASSWIVRLISKKVSK